MASRIARGACGVTAAIAVAIAVTSCNASSPLRILGILAPPPGSGTAQGCSYTVSATGPFLSVSTVDFAFTREYIPTLLLGNEVPNPDRLLDRFPPNTSIQGAHVRIAFLHRRVHRVPRGLLGCSGRCDEPHTTQLRC